MKLFECLQSCLWMFGCVCRASLSVPLTTTGKPIYQSDGSLAKVKIWMDDAQFADGTPQPLYFPEGHEHAGVFKGMAVILEEHGFANASKIHAKCKGFKCEPSATDCCCHWLLYSQPDFAQVSTILEAIFNSHGFQVKLLPKFHCELYFIQQCWGYAKQLYHLNPESSCKDYLAKNAPAVLDDIHHKKSPNLIRPK
jgi:hypothetical protein